MPRPDAPARRESAPSHSPVEVYSPTARSLHWIVLAMLLVQIPIGFYMAYRGNVLNIWDATTNALYSSHKLLGMVLLLVVVVRLGYRLVHGAPDHEPTLEPWQRLASGVNHLGIYVLLLLVPLLGWVGVSLYPALDVFGLFKLPGIVAADQKMSEVVFLYHAYAAWALIAFAGMHVAAALYHHFIRGDNVLARMIPGLLRRK